MGGGRRPTSSGGVKGFRNSVLSSVRQSGRGSAGRSGGARSRVAVEAPSPGARRVVVKARVVKNTPRSAKAAALHLAYVERDGVEKDGTKGVLYGPEGAAQRKDFEAPRQGEKHQFRLIVSPEDAQELDLTDYVRRYMARVERDLGQRLEWAAVNHYDTDHPHAHIIVRGVDCDGREVRLDRDYVSNGLRARAQELATEELGPRQEHDVKHQLEREITQDRLTSLDRELARRAKEDRVDVRQPDTGRRPRIDEALVIGRLEHLAELRLAERLTATSWALTPGWQEQLREIGMRGDIIKQMHRALQGDPGRYRAVLPGQSLNGDQGERTPMLHGRVASKGLSDELKGSFYAVIETPGGDGYYIPLDRRAAEELREGDIVSFGTKARQDRPATDRRAERGAIPSERRVVANDKESAGPTPLDMRVEQQRDKHGTNRALSVNTSEPIGNFQDPKNSRAERSAPRAEQYPMYPPPQVAKEALRLDEQVRHRGPVWLDRMSRAGLAPYGFGAEVQRAMDERERVLRALGVDPADPTRLRKLRELERRSVGEAVARQSGEQFLGKAPDGFRGQLRIAERQRGGGAYAVVSDGRRFVVMPLTHDAKAKGGKTVTLSRDSHGRLAVRAADKERGIS